MGKIADLSWVRAGRRSIGRRLLSSVAALTLALLPLQAAGSAPLRLVTGDDYPPYSDQTLPGGGVAAELIRAAFETSGQDVTIEFLPWKRGYEAVRDNEAAATFPYVPTPEREREVAYSDPIFAVHQLVFASLAHPIAYRSPSDLDGLSGCAPIGWAQPTLLEERVAQRKVTLSYAPRLENCLFLLGNARVDFFIGDPNMVWSIARAVAVDKEIATDGTVFWATSLHLIVGRTNPDRDRILAAFNAGLAKMKADGTYDRMLEAREIN